MSEIMSLLPTGANLSLFLLACLAVGASPGPGMMFAVAQAVSHGRLAGMISVLGLSAASLTWCLAAAFGIAAIIAASPIAFATLRWMGAAYLVYLAARIIVQARQPPLAAGHAPNIEPLPRIFWQAMATNLMNPKSVLFYLSFIPQFTDPSRGNVIAQFILMGIIFNLTGNAINLMVAMFFGHIGTWLSQHTNFWRAQQWFTASVFLGIAGFLFWPVG